MSPSNTTFCHCSLLPKSRRVYHQYQHPRGCPATPRKAGGSHVLPCSLYPSRDSCAPQFSSFNTHHLANSTQSPRESDRTVQGADLLPNPPTALPATLAFPQDYMINTTIPKDLTQEQLSLPLLPNSTRFVFTLWCQEIRNRQYLRKSSHPITCSAATIPPPASPCHDCEKP